MNHHDHIKSSDDVVAFLRAQHRQVKRQFERIIERRGAARALAFQELRMLLAIHETAEEVTVHPAAKRSIPNGRAIVAERLREESEAKESLSVLETLEADSMEFDIMIRALRSAVVAHAESEERAEFSQWAEKFDDDQIAKMARAVRFAESIEPIPSVRRSIEPSRAPFPTCKFESMVDRARQALFVK